MERPFFEGNVFENLDVNEDRLIKGDYENCRFIQCHFANADLSNFHFIDCEFHGCNLSMAKIMNTTFQDVIFKECKLLGLHFEHCNAFSFTVELDHCSVNLSSFYKLKIKKMKFKNSSLHEVDFTDADLTGSVFENCDLARAIFENTNLEKADLRTAINYSIDPTSNKIKKAKFSASGLPGLLHKYDLVIE